MELTRRVLDDPVDAVCDGSRGLSKTTKVLKQGGNPEKGSWTNCRPFR